jgi:1,4-alpha-glucan branching enzyme
VIKQLPVKDDSGQVKVTFAIPREAAPGRISVVGDFNGWDPLAHPLRPRSNGTRSVQVPLPAGQRYAFRYLGEGGQWLNDETATELEGDNSVLHT